ncbi:MAG: O-antigen ligase family protein [Candidatus Moraniibacteriota bacterium]
MTDATGLDGRLFGTFAEANGFASFMLVIISILLYNTFSQKNSIQDNKPQLTLLGLSILLLLLTFSRGGWLALIVLLGVFGLIKKPKALIAFTLLFIVLFFTSSKIHDRIEDVYNPPADSSIRWRIRQWNDVIETWKLSPIYGHGGGTEIIIHEQEHSYLSGDPYTHNDLLKVMQETGLIGLALFVFLLATTLILLFKKYLKLTNKNDKLFVLITLLLFLAQLSFGMSSNIWRGTAVEWIIWTLVACALSISTSKDSQIDRV